MKKSTITLSAITLLLLVLIGFGVWMLINRQSTQSHKVSKDASIEQQAKTFTMGEVASHSSKTDCWTIISGQVYDLTEFINRHPGGDEILQACGTDATTLFLSRTTKDGRAVGSGTPHSQTAQEQLATLKIGAVSN